MCRNIKTLYHLEPPATGEEVRAASLQFVRKVSGFSKPSKANEAAFEAAVEEVAAAANRLLRALQTSAPARERKGGEGQGRQRPARTPAAELTSAAPGA